MRWLAFLTLEIELGEHQVFSFFFFFSFLIFINTSPSLCISKNTFHVFNSISLLVWLFLLLWCDMNGGSSHQFGRCFGWHFLFYSLKSPHLATRSSENKFKSLTLSLDWLFGLTGLYKCSFISICYTLMLIFFHLLVRTNACTIAWHKCQTYE